ncbi:MAG: DNA-3-methyladenine glycosylase I [Gammaproteobacteria bacterium]
MQQQKIRCRWSRGNRLYERYHDKEWGVPLYNDKKLFEFLVLEGAQAGLSWITVLKKREAYRAAMDRFDFNKIARYTGHKVQSLLKNPGIIRNELKIRSTISNARAFLEIRKEFGTFARYIWRFVDYKPVQNNWRSPDKVPTTTALSDEIAGDLKKRGFSFIGSIIVYSHLQATGVINDHTTDCFRHAEVKKLVRKKPAS